MRRDGVCPLHTFPLCNDKSLVPNGRDADLPRIEEGGAWCRLK